MCLCVHLPCLLLDDKAKVLEKEKMKKILGEQARKLGRCDSDLQSETIFFINIYYEEEI